MQQRRRQTLHLRTVVGEVELQVWYGYDPGTRRWGSPIRQHWGLSAHQQLSAGLEDKLAYLATATGTYALAAAVASKCAGVSVDASTVHALVQRLGQKAEAQTQARLEHWPAEAQAQRAASALAVVMLDGWLVRQRGPGWGKKRTRQPRVAWHELKTGVFYRQEQTVRGRAEKRGQLTEKVVVSWQGEPLELGRRLHWEAQRGGLGRARAVLAVADGAPWIWNVVQDRWAQAVQVLDFYHASQHLWALGLAWHQEDEVRARPWVEARLHQLRQGRGADVLAELAGLRPRRGRLGPIVRREQNYFAAHAARMNYRTVARRGWPIGSGAVESACRQRQCRYKRSGQSWTARGLRHLCALEEARDNNHWEQLWTDA